MGTSAWSSTLTVAVLRTKTSVTLQTWRRSFEPHRRVSWESRESGVRRQGCGLRRRYNLCPWKANQDGRCPLGVPLTSKTTSKPFSDDTPQKTHCAIGSRTSVAVDLRHDMTKERDETPHPTTKKKEGNPAFFDCDQRHLSRTFRVTCRKTDRSKRRGCSFESVIQETVLPTAWPGDVAGTQLLIIHSTLTRLEDLWCHSDSRLVLRVDLVRLLHDPPRTHISNTTRSGGAAVHPTYPCRIFQTRVRGARGVRISWKLWKAPRRSRYQGNTRPRRLGTFSGSRMRFIQVNGERCVTTFSDA